MGLDFADTSSDHPFESTFFGSYVKDTMDNIVTYSWENEKVRTTKLGEENGKSRVVLAGRGERTNRRKKSNYKKLNGLGGTSCPFLKWPNKNKTNIKRGRPKEGFLSDPIQLISETS